MVPSFLQNVLSNEKILIAIESKEIHLRQKNCFIGKAPFTKPSYRAIIKPKGGASI